MSEYTDYTQNELQEGDKERENEVKEDTVEYKGHIDFTNDVTVTKLPTPVTEETLESARRKMEILGMATGFAQGLNVHLGEYPIAFADGGSSVKTPAEQYVDIIIQIADWLVD